MRIKVSASTCVTAFGMEPENIWQACVREEPSFDDGLGYIPEAIREAVKEKISPELKDPLFEKTQSNPLFLWSLFCLKEAMKQMGIEDLTERDGIILATTTGLTHLWEAELMKHFNGEASEGPYYQPLGSLALELKNQLGFSGPMQIVSSACAAGTQALGIGKTWLSHSYVDRCFVLGAEQVCQLTDRGFRSLSLVSGEGCFPFNENHKNICLSEAAACICLTRESGNEGVFLTGFGCSSDTHSMTAPRPDGSGPYGAMTAALHDADLGPLDINWIHAHGTGSLQNDRAEAAAVFKLNKEIPITSTKGVHGHSLAASGVLESILCVEALKRQEVLATAGAQPESFKVNICQVHEKRKLSHVLKNTLGFGGINSSLVFSRGEGLDA